MGKYSQGDIPISQESMEALLTLACRREYSGTEIRNYFCQYVTGRNYVFLYAGPMKVRNGNTCFLGSYNVLPAYN